MLNNPNEWHNEEETEQNTDDLPEEEYEQYDGENGEYTEDEYIEGEEGEYEDDGDFEEAGEDNDGLKKKIIIAVSILVVFLVSVGGILGFKSLSSKKNANQDIAVAETPVSQDVVTDDSETGIDIEAVDGEGNDEDEISIDVEVENSDNTATEGISAENNATASEEEVGLSVPVESADKKTETKVAEAQEEGGLQVKVEDAPPIASVPGNNQTVTISIGDVGRKTPFMPKTETKIEEVEDNPSVAGMVMVADEEFGEQLNFDVIEPPELGRERADIAKLLQTRVTGILFDDKKPSAIINIDGMDQLVKIGDRLSGFEFIAITKNKVVIRDGNNIFRASVGQPLNAEKINNPIEISNLQTKFWGSTMH